MALSCPDPLTHYLSILLPFQIAQIPLTPSIGPNDKSGRVSSGDLYFRFNSGESEFAFCSENMARNGKVIYDSRHRGKSEQRIWNDPLVGKLLGSLFDAVNRRRRNRRLAVLARRRRTEFPSVAAAPRETTRRHVAYLIFLYGNLFCYIASYPVLVFHATRVIDFSDGKWPAKRLSDGYLTAFAFTILAFAFFHLGSAGYRFWAAFALALLLGGVQFRRLYLAISSTIQIQGLSGAVSQAFGYTYALARRRGIPEETETCRSSQNANQELDELAEFGGEVTTSRTIAWRREFIETYRHLREHGNSAVIFLFEIGLAGLVYSVIKKPGQTAAQQMGAIGTLFAIWAVPSVFVHLLGQHFERRFSWYDRRVGSAGPQVDSSAQSQSDLKPKPKGSTG